MVGTAYYLCRGGILGTLSLSLSSSSRHSHNSIGCREYYYRSPCLGMDLAYVPRRSAGAIHNCVSVDTFLCGRHNDSQAEVKMPRVKGFRAIDKIMLAGGWGFRLFIRLIIILPILFIIIVVSLAYFNRPAQPPTVQEAPWAIQTESRIFYAQKCVTNEGNPVITGYWYLKGKKYRFEEGSIYFDKTEWGTVIVVRRIR